MKPRYRTLLDKAIAATVAAIEIYNKPDFQYRAETFSILAINGWELLLKAKWLNNNGNKIQSLYVWEKRENKDGSKSQRLTIKRTRSQNPFTISLYDVGEKLTAQGHLEKNAWTNIKALLEVRDSAIHFYNPSRDLTKKLQEIGAASLKNFAALVEEWFGYDLSKFNFYLMPLAFVDLPTQAKAIVPNKEEKNFLKYLKQLESKVADLDSDYSVTVDIDVKFTRSKAKNVPGVNIVNSKDPNVIDVRMTEEDMREKYPWDYQELTQRCRKRYSDFKLNKEHHGIMKTLNQDKKFCHIRYLDPGNPKSSTKKLYNPNILNEFDNHYSKKGK